MVTDSAQVNRIDHDLRRALAAKAAVDRRIGELSLEVLVLHEDLTNLTMTVNRLLELRCKATR